MIDCRIYRRFGELKNFLQLFKHDNDKITCTAEIYKAHGCDAVEFNFHSEYYNILSRKDKDFALSKLFGESKEDPLSSRERVLLNKWEELSKWRNSGERSTNYICDMTLEDVRQISVCLESWCHWNSEKLYKQVSKEQEKRKLNKEKDSAFLIVNELASHMGKLKAYVKCVEDLCCYVTGKHKQQAIGALKMNKSYPNKEEAVQLYTIINQIKNYTEDSVRITDAYNELEKIVVKKWLEPVDLRQLKDSLNFLRYYVSQ